MLLTLQPADAGMVELSVADTGPGLSADQLTGLFQPFNRLGQEHGKIEGTGIGLVIARRLAELMNGELRVASEPGRGSVFTLRLPAPAADMPSRAGAASAATPAVRWAGPRQAVYIEDNPGNVEVMHAIVAQRQDIHLTVFENGASGLAHVAAEPPDLLMLDMHLPDIDGLEILRRLRELPQCADTLVLIVSADAVEHQIRRGREAGAAHYVTKPVDVNEMLALLDRLVAAPAVP